MPYIFPIIEISTIFDSPPLAGFGVVGVVCVVVGVVGIRCRARQQVKRLEAVETSQTPVVASLETKVLQLGLTSGEMEPSVQMLMRSFSKVNETVQAIEQLEKGRQGVEAERVRREGQMSQQKRERHCCRSKGDASQLFDAQGTELA